MNYSNNTKKVAVLAGVSMLVGAGVPVAESAVLPSQTVTFDFTGSHTSDVEPSVTDNFSLSFNSFDTSLGTLTGVTLDLSSWMGSGEGLSHTAAVSIDGTELASQTNTTPYIESFFNFAGLDATGGGAIALGFFEGDGISLFDIDMAFTTETSGYFGANGWWVGNGVYNYYDQRTGQSGTPTGLTVTFEYTPSTVPTVPTPATLPLIALGLAGLGYIRSRKDKPAQ